MIFQIIFYRAAKFEETSITKDSVEIGYMITLLSICAFLLWKSPKKVNMLSDSKNETNQFGNSNKLDEFNNPTLKENFQESKKEIEELIGKLYGEEEIEELLNDKSLVSFLKEKCAEFEELPLFLYSLEYFRAWFHCIKIQSIIILLQIHKDVEKYDIKDIKKIISILSKSILYITEIYTLTKIDNGVFKKINKFSLLNIYYNIKKCELNPQKNIIEIDKNIEYGSLILLRKMIKVQDANFLQIINLWKEPVPQSNSEKQTRFSKFFKTGKTFCKNSKNFVIKKVQSIKKIFTKKKNPNEVLKYMQEVNDLKFTQVSKIDEEHLMILRQRYNNVISYFQVICYSLLEIIDPTTNVSDIQKQCNQFKLETLINQIKSIITWLSEIKSKLTTLNSEEKLILIFEGLHNLIDEDFKDEESLNNCLEQYSDRLQEILGQIQNN